MSEIALSFVIPVYKKPVHVIEKCLKSILTQSLKEYELILVLDGEDSVLERAITSVLKKVKAPWRVIVQEHGGAPRARNRGISEAKGRYVVCWDADCYIEPHTAKAWVEVLDKRKEVDFCYSGYSFAGEKGGIQSEPFDPFTLRVANYISGCFPIRRDKAPKWCEDLKSLQDWDFWLSAVDNGSKGHFLPGYAFSTEFPDPESISGKGCTSEVWLERVDAVKARHNIPIRKVCVTSVNDKHDGLAIAKLIDADYHDRPNDKPNHYETIIQIGLSLNPQVVEIGCTAWGTQHKKILFWTRDNIEEIYNGISLHALEEYSMRLNQTCTQFVEDKASQRIMQRAGFNVNVMHLPVINEDQITPLPTEPRFLVDASRQYAHVLNVIKKALPDVKLEIAQGAQAISDYTGLIHFYADRTIGSSIKRMLVNGRHVISNVQSPFAGFLEDKTTDEKFIVATVERVRQIVKKPLNIGAVDYYKKALSVEKLKEAIRG